MASCGAQKASASEGFAAEGERGAYWPKEIHNCSQETGLVAKTPFLEQFRDPICLETISSSQHDLDVRGMPNSEQRCSAKLQTMQQILVEGMVPSEKETAQQESSRQSCGVRQTRIEQAGGQGQELGILPEQSPMDCLNTDLAAAPTEECRSTRNGSASTAQHAHTTHANRCQRRCGSHGRGGEGAYAFKGTSWNDGYAYTDDAAAGKLRAEAAVSKSIPGPHTRAFESARQGQKSSSGGYEEDSNSGSGVGGSHQENICQVSGAHGDVPVHSSGIDGAVQQETQRMVRDEATSSTGIKVFVGERRRGRSQPRWRLWTI